jgi:benzoyl-CoA reductase/2-hydroxyglutaryl-CoA dehydratase subunit BcrC/BadD/HgdB
MEITAIIKETSRKAQFSNFHQLLKNATTKKESPYYTLESSKKRMHLTANLFRKAYREDSVVVWRSSFLPTEPLFALDFVPFPAESTVSILTSSGLGAKILNSAEEEYHSRDTCSFLRGTYGAVKENCLPTPDFLACTSLYCDASAKLFYSLSRKYNKPYFYIDVPYHHEQDYAIDYVAKQIEEMTENMAKVTGRKVDYSRLTKAITFSNEARDYFLKINELRKLQPAPMLGGEALNHTVVLAHTWGCKEIVDVYKLLYEELKERTDKKIGAIEGGEKHRILWRNLKPYYSDYIMSYLELERKAVIAFEEANYIYWEKMDSNEPYKSLAKRMLANPPLGDYRRWLGVTLLVADEYKADGIIEFAHWGCRHLNSSTQILKDILKDKEVPVLILDGDCIDSRDYSEAQIKTRIDAFLEILERRKQR